MENENTVPSAEQITVTGIKEYLTLNAETDEVKGLMQEIAPKNTDNFEELLTKNEGFKSWVNTFADKRVTDGIKSYETNKLPALKQEMETTIRQEITPDETPDQKRIRKLEVDKIESDNKARLSDLENFAIRKANQLKIEGIGNNMDMFITDSEDDIIKRLEFFSDVKKFEYEKGRAHMLKDNVHTPKGGDNDEKLQWNSPAEYDRYCGKNPGKFDPVMFEKIANQEQRR